MIDFYILLVINIGFIMLQALKDALSTRRVELVGILRLQHFYRDANELEKWVHERMQRATEETWKSAANLEVN